VLSPGDAYGGPLRRCQLRKVDQKRRSRRKLHRYKTTGNLTRDVFRKADFYFFLSFFLPPISRFQAQIQSWYSKRATRTQHVSAYAHRFGRTP
jgi:hypothetical protein